MLVVWGTKLHSVHVYTYGTDYRIWYDVHNHTYKHAHTPNNNIIIIIHMPYLQMISVSCLDLSYSVEPIEGKIFKDESEDETDFITLCLTSEEQLLLPQVTNSLI